MCQQKKCKTFEVFGKCKFDKCAYLHVKKEHKQNNLGSWKWSEGANMVMNAKEEYIKQDRDTET